MKNSKAVLCGIVLGSLLFSGNVFADYFVKRCHYGYCSMVRVIDRPYWHHGYYNRWHYNRWHYNHWHHWRR